MAPGLNGRQTGTVPKNKPRNSGSQSHRSTRDALIHFASLDWEPVTDPANRTRSRRKSSLDHSETEADSLRYDVNRSRSSTMTSQQHLVDNDNGEISWLNSNGSDNGGHNSVSNGSSRQSSHHGRQHNTWPNHPNSNLQNGDALSSSNSMNIPDRKQVINKLAVIQDYIQQTASLMNTLKASDTPSSRNQYKKLSAVLDDLRDSETKLRALLNNMDRTESRIDDLLADIESNEGMSNNNRVMDVNEDEELIKRSEDSKKKVEALERRKQELIDLHEKAKRQLQEAQAEEGRLIASANSLNQELHASKLMEQNLQQLSQRLHNIQQVYKTKNQIKENLAIDDREEAEHPDEEQAELSDTETDYQLVADKMAELNALKAQLNQIQRTMAAVHSEQNGDETSGISRDTSEAKKEHCIQHNRNDTASQDQNMTVNAVKLEQARTKLTQLNHLLELIQNSSGLSPAYMQRVSNVLKEEGGSSSHSPSPSCSGRSQPRPGDEMSIETMQMMTRELEERTAAMKEERDKLIAARQHLQRVAGKIPVAKTETESLSPDDDSESEAPCLLPSGLDQSGRDVLNATVSTDPEQIQSCSENSPYVCRTMPSRNRQRASWNTSLPTLPTSSRERRCKNETLSRASNQSSVRGSSRNRHRDPGRWSPSPAASFCENPALSTQSQLEMTNNLCERMLADSMNRGQELSIDELFAQHQMLTKTVAQCSQLLWLQQKQITELRNALMLNQLPVLPNTQSVPSQSQANMPLPNNQSPFPSLSLYGMLTQNLVPQNQKLNSGDMQNAQMPQDFQEFYHPGLNFPPSMPDGFRYDSPFAGFNRFNPQQINPSSNLNQNLNQNQPTPGLNNRVPAGINCIGPEDSGALNNQVPPGNRANNYWDNFRSYSRQNLLSNTKSNEETDTTRRILTSNQERITREGAAPLANQNNPSTSSQTNTEASETADQYLLPVNTRSNPSQITRSRSVEPQNLRNTVKNESRNQENDSRAKNETTGARLRNPEQSTENIRNVRNDVSQPSRNVDHTRNFMHLGNFDNEEVAQGNNKKQVEKSRCRNETRNLNSRSDINNGLFLVLRDNVYSEVTNFIRANENRPHFLIQLFRDLQQVTTDSLRQRTLESIEETVNANNLTERTNSNGANVNLIENRNNIRENRSNLNRNQPEDHARIDALFYHLRENQNTIRQNIGSANFAFSGNNLENPNISNIRDLGNSRNNLENEGLRDLRTYFEANLCNFGHNSALENPNLSNIRENLTRRGPMDYENINPKNVYLSMYDNIVEDMRRRNQESASNPQFVAPYGNFGNFEEDSHYIPNDSNRPSNNFSISSLPTLDNNFELREDNELSDNRSRFGIMDRGDSFMNRRDFMANGNNDSGIDINFNTEDRKANYLNRPECCEGNVIPKKNEQVNDEEEGAVALMPSDWDRNSVDNNSFISSLSLTRYDMSSFTDTVCEKSSFVNCSPLQQSDNGDLAEADQSRNEETSGAESDSGFINLKAAETESSFAIDQNPETAPESNFSIVQTEEENSFVQNNATEPEGNFIFQNSTSEPEGNFLHNSPEFQWNENSEAGFSFEPETGAQKQGKKRNEVKKSETNGDLKKGPVKNLTNKFRDNTFKADSSNSEEPERQKIESDESKKCGEHSEGSFSPLQNFQFPPPDSDRGNASPEAEADWEMENGLDQVPTRLEKNESPRKPA